MHVILWDIDGTLLASGGAGKAAFESALVETFGLAGVRSEIPYAGRTDRGIARDLFAAHDIRDTADNFARHADAYLARLPDCLAAHGGRVLPGVAALLDTLRARPDVALGLLTGNTRRGAELKLSHFGLSDHFAFGGYGDRHHDRDDVARDAYRAAREYLGRDCRDSLWVIGDTPADVRCARAIGAKAVAVATGWHSPETLAACEPDLLLADLSAPDAWLALLPEHE